jgi:Flp pilus assembly protein TadG
LKLGERAREERGASAVEFAIIASLLLLIVFGVIQFGILLNRFQGLQSAGREGARIGSLSQTPMSQIQQRVKDSVSVIQGTSIQNSCTGWAAAVETGCISVTTKSDNNNDGDTTDSGEVVDVSSNAASFQPCNGPPVGGRSVVVDVKYRLRLEIPFWASPQMTIDGAGEFRCEG